jgi:hypothetical protein
MFDKFNSVLKCSITPPDNFSINNIMDINNYTNGDSLLCYIDFNKYFFYGPKNYYKVEKVKNDIDDNGLKIDFYYNNVLCQHDSLDAIEDVGYDKNSKGLKTFYFDNNLILIYKLKSDFNKQVIESINFKSKFIKKIILDNYSYIGDDTENVYFCYNDSNVNKLNQFKIIKFIKTLNDTVNYDSENFNKLEINNDSINIKIDYLGNNYLIIEDISKDNKNKVNKITAFYKSDELLANQQLFFTTPYCCIPYCESIIFVGFQLRKSLKNIYSYAYVNIIKLNQDDSSEVILDAYTFTLAFIYQNPSSIKGIKIFDNILLILTNTPSYINDKYCNGTILLYDLLEKQFITKPIKYIDLTEDEQ